MKVSFHTCDLMIPAIFCYLHMHGKLVIGSPTLRLLDFLIAGKFSGHREEIQHGFVCRRHDPFHIRGLARRIAIAAKLITASERSIQGFLGNQVDASTLKYAHQLPRPGKREGKSLTRAQKSENSSSQSSRSSPSQTYPLPNILLGQYFRYRVTVGL